MNFLFKVIFKFCVLLTVYPGTTLGNWPTWCTITLYKTFFYYNPLHVSSNTLLIIRSSNRINTASGIVFSVSDRAACTPDGHLQRILCTILYCTILYYTILYYIYCTPYITQLCIELVIYPELFLSFQKIKVFHSLQCNLIPALKYFITHD